MFEQITKAINNGEYPMVRFIDKQPSVLDHVTDPAVVGGRVGMELQLTSCGSVYPDLQFNGKLVTDYETEAYDASKSDFDIKDVLFTYAEFEDGTSLTAAQLVKLSKQYRHILYRLIKNDLPITSPYHQEYGVNV